MFLSLREETLLTTLFTHYAPLAPMLLAPLWGVISRSRSAERRTLDAEPCAELPPPQFTREAKVGHSGSPICDCGGIRRWTCYKKCTSASALSPQLPLVRRESGCTGVYRSDSLDTLMQEECAHFRVDAIRRRKRGPFLSF